VNLTFADFGFRREIRETMHLANANTDLLSLIRDP